MPVSIFADLSAALADDVRLYPMDLPGQGAIPPPEDCRALDDWADACLDAAPQCATWLGWSLGGLIALAAALRAPERVESVVLLAATPRFVVADDWPRAMDASTFDAFRASLDEAPAATLARFAALEVKGAAAARTHLRQLRQMLAEAPDASPEALAIGLDLLRDTDLRAALRALDRPSLWLFGELDGLVPVGVADAIVGLCPSAQVERIRGAAHVPMLSHPVPCADLVHGFMRSDRG